MNGNSYNRKATELSAQVKSLIRRITNITNRPNSNIVTLKNSVTPILDQVKKLKGDVSEVQKKFVNQAQALLNDINRNNISKENKSKLNNYTSKTVLRKIRINISKKTTTIRKMDGIIRDLTRLSGNAKAKATNNAAKAKATKNSEAQEAVQRAAKNAEAGQVSSIKTQLNELLTELSKVNTKIGYNNSNNGGNGFRSIFNNNTRKLKMN